MSLSLPRNNQGPQDDGPSFTITMYFAMKPETRDILRRVTAKDYRPSAADPKHAAASSGRTYVNAVRLFDEWCRLSPDDPKFQGRFKVIPLVRNIQDLGLPGWIAHWNGKPVLITRAGKTGFVHHHPEQDCTEMEISFHPFPWAARQVIQYLREHLPHKLLLTFGFLIEGRNESELPECLIGLGQLCFPKPKYAIPVDEFFSPQEKTQLRPRVQSLHPESFQDV